MLLNKIIFSRHIFLHWELFSRTQFVKQRDHWISKWKLIHVVFTPKNKLCCWGLSYKFHYWKLGVHHMANLQWRLAECMLTWLAWLRSKVCIFPLASSSNLSGYRSSSQSVLSLFCDEAISTWGAFPFRTTLSLIVSTPNSALQRGNSLQLHKPVKFLKENISELLTRNLLYNMISHNSYENHEYK